jgi:cell division protein FtsQ
MAMNGTASLSQRRNEVIIRASVPRPRRAIRRRFPLLKLIVGLLSTAGCIAAGYFLYVGLNRFTESSFFTITRVAVLGNQVIDQQKVVDSSAVREGQNIFSLNLADIRDKVKLDPYVSDASVRRELPGTVVIEVTERNPIGVLSVGGTGYLVSDDGVVLEKMGLEDDFDFPLLMATPDNTFSIGDRLPDPDILYALTILLSMREKTPTCYTRLETMEVFSETLISLKLKNCDGLFLIGPGAVEESLTRLDLLLPKLLGVPFTTVDLRFSSKAIIKFSTELGG